MTLHEQLKEDLKGALKRREKAQLGVIRNILSAIVNELVAQERHPQDILEDQDTIKTIRRLAKQRKDSIEQYERGNRPDLAAEEQEELVLLEAYLPATMKRGEIEPVIKAKKEELGITDPKDKGKLIGAIMQSVGDTVEGELVRDIVDDLFKNQ